MIASVKRLLEIGVPAGARNNMGQTALHFACGSHTASMFGPKVDPFDFVLNSEIGKSINTADNHGVRPIHLAATISEFLLAKMIQRGGDPTAVTHEGKNLLHILARTRQTNSIGLLLEHFSAIGRTDIINTPDEKGRTALHEACRSGRPESVALLLEAGADVNVKDKEGLSPLHACAEFQDENLLWSPAASKLTPPRRMAACGILDADPLRPEPKDSYGSHRPYPSSWRTSIFTEQDTVRIREIVRLLINRGAELGPTGRKSAPFNLAVTNGVSEMVDELLPHMERHWANGSTGGYRSDRFTERYLIGLTNATVLESDLMKDGGADNSYLCETLLALGKYSAIEQLPGMGVDLVSKPQHRNDFLTTLTQFGYASLLETLGATISDPTWVNGKENTVRDPYGRTDITPYIVTAAKSRLPNLDVLKVLIEKFNANVNIQPVTQVYQPDNSRKHLPGASTLHILACGTYWWQKKGLEYLLQHGADTELKNEKGQTALHVAVSNEHMHGSYHRKEIVKILLDHGANPNATADDGSTCLNSAMHDVEFVRLLVKHGADITLGDRPALFSAISAQDVAAVAALVEAGADCNVRQKPVEKPKRGRFQHDRIQQHEYYAVHFAASTQFNTPKTRETAIQIIKLLLDNGADPFLNFRDDATIIHDIFEHGGILQPFLDIPNLDLERRDPKGRTLLLAAARSNFGTHSPSTFPHEMFGLINWQEIEAEHAKFRIGDPRPAQTLYEKGGDLLAVDNEGNNVLHFLNLAAVHNFDEYKKTFILLTEKVPSLIHQKNAEGWTPFHYAIKGLRFWNVEHLLTAGADPLERDSEGNTALHHLAPKLAKSTTQKEYLTWWNKFLSLGLPINVTNNKGETPIFGYFSGGKYDSDDLHRKHFGPLEDAGADLFVRNSEGETLLHVVATRMFSAGYNHPSFPSKPDTADTFRFLMERGLDPMAEDGRQRTALDVAAACGNAAVLRLFKRDRGAVPVAEEE